MNNPHPVRTHTWTYDDFLETCRTEHADDPRAREFIIRHFPAKPPKGLTARPKAKRYGKVPK